MLGVVVAVGLALDLATKYAAFRWVAGQPVPVVREQVLEVSRIDPRGIQALVPAHEPVTVVPSVLDFTLVLNPGAVFGIGPGGRWFFVGFTTVVFAVGLWMFASWTRASDRVAHVGIGLLLAGGIGNLYDRLRYACVRDFIHPLPGVRWPGGWKPFGGTGEIWPYVSNVADLLLILGILAMLWSAWFAGDGRGESAEAPAPARTNG